MGVLETFVILFESDADEVKKGADEAKKSTDKLDDSLKNSNKAADQLGGKFLGMATAATTAIAAFLSVGAITAGVFAAAQYADQLDEASESLGTSVEELDAWGGAAKQAGGSLEGLIGSVRGLAASMAQMDTTGKSKVLPFFKELGIQMTDTAGRARPIMELLPEIASAFEGLSKEQAIGFGRKLGLDTGTIMLLQKGRREVDALIARQKELGTIRQEDAAAAATYNDALDDTARVFRSLFSIIAGDVLPVLTSFLEGFQEIGMWMQDHEGFIYGFFSTLIGLMTVLGVRAALAAIPLLALAWPFIAIGAAVLALSVLMGLLWDDFQKWISGAPSLLAPVWEFFSGLGDSITGIFDRIKENVLGVINDIKGAVAGVKGIFGGGNNDIITKAQMELYNASNTPLSSQTAASLTAGNTSSTAVSINEVNVQTQATDADGISGAIGKSLESQLRQTVNNNDDGIKG